MPAKPVEKQVPSGKGIFKKFKGNIEAIAIGVKFFFNPQRFTLVYPKEYIKLREGYRGFIVLIKDKCINCGSCARICPAAAMRLIKLPFTDPKTGKTRMKLWPVINYNRCIFCGYCVDVCPTEALYHVPYQDVVYENMEIMDRDLDEFQEEPERDIEKVGIPVRYVVDEKMGLIKVRVEGGEEK